MISSERKLGLYGCVVHPPISGRVAESGDGTTTENLEEIGSKKSKQA